MECFGVYDEMSLFFGDLLAGVNPLACELPFPGQDECAQEPLMFPDSVDLFADEPLKPSQPDPLPQPIDDWMEKKMELINLFSSPNIQVTIQHDSPDNIQAGMSPTDEVGLSMESAQVNSFDQEQSSGLYYEDKSTTELLHELSCYLSSDLEATYCSASSPVKIPFQDGKPSGIKTADELASMLSIEELADFGSPILSPVSAEDIESVLSACPSSPSTSSSVRDCVVPQIHSTVDLSGVVLKEDLSASLSQSSSVASNLSMEIYNDSVESDASYESHAGPVRSSRRCRRVKKPSPYYATDEDYEEEKCFPKSSRSTKIQDKAERKKQQNKDAALRYRMKKKEELGGVSGECDTLENTNKELKDKVESMTREIRYLKDLLLEVYKAKGITPKGLK